MEAVVYPGHPLYDRDSLSLEDLKGEPLLCLNEHFSIYHNVVERCGDFGFTPHFAVKTMESSLIYQFCQEGRGIGIDAAIHPVEAPLRQIPLRETSPWQVSLCAPKRAEEPCSRNCWQCAPRGNNSINDSFIPSAVSLLDGSFFFYGRVKGGKNWKIF